MSRMGEFILKISCSCYSLIRVFRLKNLAGKTKLIVDLPYSGKAKAPENFRGLFMPFTELQALEVQQFARNSFHVLPPVRQFSMTSLHFSFISLPVISTRKPLSISVTFTLQHSFSIFSTSLPFGFNTFKYVYVFGQKNISYAFGLPLNFCMNSLQQESMQQEFKE